MLRRVAAVADFRESVERCRDLARWGADAQVACRELDPGRIERTARPAGDEARHPARDQREVKERLEEPGPEEGRRWREQPG